MSVRIGGLTGATLEHAPTVCHTCMWWQSRTGGESPVIGRTAEARAQ